jgi:uncharacterized membrane protein
LLLSIVDFFGRLHPVLVHLPIGILLMGLLLQWLSRNPKYGISHDVIKIVLLCGMFSALASCITGYLLSLSGDYDETLVTWHMWMGLCVVVVSMLLFVKVVKRENDLTYRALSIGLLLLITVTGHLGGSLTHGSDYLTGALGAASGPAAMVHKPIPDIKEAKVYADVIQPMLQANCYSCHGPNKQKGKLRLDDSAWIVRGGKDGLVIHPSRPAESELVKRMLLPEEDDHHMPTKEKTPLKESEVAIFQWWIGQGADFSRKVKEFPQPGKIGSYLLALQAGNAVGGGAKAVSLVPDAPMEAAAEKDVEALRGKKVEVTPVARGSHYLSADFINAVNITDKDLDLLLPLQKQLVWLKLGDHPVGDSGMIFIGQCRALTVLHLNNTRISDKGLVSLESLHNLRVLNLVGTGITAHGVVSLDSLKQLQSLYLYRTKVEPKDWRSLKQHFPKTALDSGGYTVPFVPWDTINEMRPKPVKK